MGQLTQVHDMKTKLVECKALKLIRSQKLR